MASIYVEVNKNQEDMPGVSDVQGSSPISSSGGATPTISLDTTLNDDYTIAGSLNLDTDPGAAIALQVALTTNPNPTYPAISIGTNASAAKTFEGDLVIDSGVFGDRAIIMRTDESEAWLYMGAVRGQLAIGTSGPKEVTLDTNNIDRLLINGTTGQVTIGYNPTSPSDDKHSPDAPALSVKAATAQSVNIFEVLAADGTTPLAGADKDGNVFGSMLYTPTTASDWAGTAPTTVQEALDRCATLLKSLNSDTGP